jgi:predicted GH43/DUF377 family glycosyl hydrolase
MKTNTSIKLLIISAILLVVLAACGTVEATNDSQHVIKFASEIADFEPPQGFTVEYGAEMAGYTLAAYKGTAGPSHLFLIQSDNEADREELSNMLNQLAPGSSDPNARLTVIENRPVTIRGEEATLVISQGANHEGQLYRQAAVAFEGKGGPAMLVFSETLELWDQNSVDALLQSIE